MFCFKNMTTQAKTQFCCYLFQYALIGNVIVEVLGGIFFFIAAIFVIKDRLRVHEYLASKLLQSNMFCGFEEEQESIWKFQMSNVFQ